MSKNKLDQLVKELREIMKNGSEEDTRKFIVDHMEEFPEELKQKLTFLFFQEGLAKAATGEDKEVFDLQKKGIEALRAAEEDTDQLLKKAKIESIKGTLSEDNKE